MATYSEHAKLNAPSAKVRRWTFAVVSAAFLLGVVSAAVDVRLGLFAAALILGWTQLVGL